MKNAKEFVFSKVGITKVSKDNSITIKSIPNLSNAQWYELMEEYAKQNEPQNSNSISNKTLVAFADNYMSKNNIDDSHDFRQGIMIGIREWYKEHANKNENKSIRNTVAVEAVFRKHFTEQFSLQDKPFVDRVQLCMEEYADFYTKHKITDEWIEKEAKTNYPVLDFFSKHQARRSQSSREIFINCANIIRDKLNNQPNE